MTSIRQRLSKLTGTHMVWHCDGTWSDFLADDAHEAVREGDDIVLHKWPTTREYRRGIRFREIARIHLPPKKRKR